MKKTATIILNRNLPQETDRLVEHLMEYDGKYSDFFVIEAGSEKNNLSKYHTWHIDTPEAVGGATTFTFTITSLVSDSQEKELTLVT